MNDQDKLETAIAIVGAAGRFPKARNIEEFWQNLRAGVESISFFTDEELTAGGIAVPRNNPDYIKARGVLEDVELFDAAFFGMNPKEVEITDPQQRVFLECAWEALEHAGYDSERFKGSIGVFAGMSMSTYLMANLATRPDLMEMFGAFQMQLANDKDFLTTRVSYKLNLKGPSLNIQTGCSTSLVTVCVACQHLLNYQCDMALAGGVSITVPQKHGYLYQEEGIGSDDGHTRTFDARARGTAFSDAVGLVVLKRLNDAIADGDNVLAVIRGFSINNDGSQKVGFAAPSVEGQAEVIATAQAMAGVEPATISYIEAHGTATPVGDTIEIAGLTKAFRSQPCGNGFCAIGSVKTNVGHTDVAAGVTGLIKTTLALQHRELPASLHYSQPNPKIDFANSPFYVNHTLTDWKAGPTPRRAGVSAFGIGGTNAHVVLEEAAAPAPAASSRPWQVLVLSARTNTALAQAEANLAAHLKAHPDVNLADVAYTLQTGRRAFEYRRSLVCRDLPEAIKVLEAKRPVASVTGGGSVAFLFPGQGAQVAGMGRELSEAEPVFRQAMDRCAALLGIDLRTVLESQEQLNQTRFTQPALFAIEYALAQLWLSWGVKPAAMIGHSIGEYVAACLAGVFSLEDALSLVAARGRLMQQLPAGSMLAVRMPEAELLPLLGAELSLATVNSPGACVAAGHTAAIHALEEKLKTRGVVSKVLATSHAFHSAMMDPIAGEFIALVQKAKLNAPQIPYVSNVTGTWITAAEATAPEYWFKHLRQTVRFAAGMATLLKETQPVMLEVGPGRTLSALARQQSAQTVVTSLPVETPEQAAILAALGGLWQVGVAVDWSVFNSGERRRRVPLPTYPFERQRYWIEPKGSKYAPVVPLPAAAVPIAQDGQVIGQLRELLTELSGRDHSVADSQATFVELGAESLFLSQFSLALAKRFGVKVSFRQLFGELATLDLLAKHLEKSVAPISQPVAEQAPVSLQTLPLTEMQQEVWLATVMGNESSCAFNLSCTPRLRGPVRRELLFGALQELVRRHDALRATFSPVGDEQWIAPQLTVPLAVSDFSVAPPAAREKQLADLLAAESAQPFDLEHGPVLRVRLVKLDEHDHVLMFTVHHIACDGRSLELLLGELGALYSAACQAVPAEIAAPHSFTAYVQEEIAQHNRPERTDDEKYWLQQFTDTAPALELPTDRPRPPAKTFRGVRMGVPIPLPLGRALKGMSAQHGCTLFTTLLAAYYVLLARLAGQEDLVVGVPMSSPNAEGRHRLVGHTVNYLPMRSRLAATMRWGDYLEDVQRLVLATHEHRQFTYGSLIQKLKLSRDAGRLPLVSAGFTLTYKRYPLQYFGLQTQLDQNPNGYTNVDFTFDFTVDGDAVLLESIHNPDLFETATVQRWLGHFMTLLEGIVASPQSQLGELPLLNTAERRQVVTEWNETRRAYPLESVRLHQLFEAQVERTPDAPAVVFESQSLSYRALNQRANQLANALRKRGVGPDQLVGICVERSVEMVVGLLGILKAGGAYVPLDPEYPKERLAFMLQDANVPVLLTQQKFVSAVPAHNAQVICLDAELAGESDANLKELTTPDNLAYMIYTSGSTGKPKGALNTHRGICSRLLWMQEQYQLRPADAVMQKTPFSFDVSVWEFFWPLLAGARLVVARPGGHQDPDYLVNLITQQQITVMHFVPSMLQVFVEAVGVERCSALRHVICSGEALSFELQERFFAKMPAQLHNLYGPTEAAVDVTYWDCRRDGALRIVPIGRPVANTQCYILDARLQPVPIGVGGELHLGGVQVGRGYHRRPELTAEKFIADPFLPGSRLYKTGDLCRYLPDGNIEYLGRLDHQVKIRGFRIELGEIQAALEQHSAVREAVVVAREDVPGDKQLVAYVVAPGEPPLREFLGKTLPNYMVPAVFVFMEKLPLAPNGKVDRRALPAPAATKLRNFVAPSTPVEKVVAETWCEILRVPQAGIHDNFFELGGHSLLAVQVASRLRKILEVEFPLRTLFEKPTVAELASHLGNLACGRQGQQPAQKSATVVVTGEL